jgi:hypothetical protein
MTVRLLASVVVLILPASDDPSAGTVVGAHGQFEVLVPSNAPHAYSAVGTYALKATITDQDGTSVLATDSVIIGDIITGEPANLSVATFTNLAPNAVYNTSITWGDGTTSTGTVSSSPGGTAEITGTHTYATAGVFTVRAQLQSGDGVTLSFAQRNIVAVPAVAQAPGAIDFSALLDQLNKLVQLRATVYSSAAFDLPIAKHLGLQVDLLVGGVVHKTWRFELHGYNDPTENPAFRLGAGPAGPGGYLNSIARAYASPAFGPFLRNVAFLKNLSDTTKANLGVDFPFAWNISQGLAEFFLAGSLRNAYGIYLAPTPAQGTASRLGQISPLQLLSLLLTTSDIASKTSTEGFFLDTPGSHTTVTSADGFQLLPPGQFVLHPSMQTGLGYDPLNRNSNTFIGTILRAAGLAGPVPQNLKNVAVGFGSTFTDWTNWDLALQNYISAQAKAAGL